MGRVARFSVKGGLVRWEVVAIPLLGHEKFVVVSMAHGHLVFKAIDRIPSVAQKLAFASIYPSGAGSCAIKGMDNNQHGSGKRGGSVKRINREATVKLTYDDLGKILNFAKEQGLIPMSS
jgi:hypothetical protein